ncbi:Protein kinase superfamily protein [Rhynchospora pubera]|uniref:non-specific serine/threonine protein kinase n=1 Tax=Rhynchospora pubera TaxID=906938 RepID=A0AAV8EXH3_9POAL|nr:Protein kinase superfamily protein [Rhynchospora pubera]
MRALPPTDGSHLQIERAWYVSTVLLRLGRPVRPLELDLNPDLAESLCQVDGSPLSLTDDGLVTLSGSAFSHLLRFWSYLVVSSATSGSQWGQEGVVCVRKRKERGYECVMPLSKKRRLLIGCERDAEELEKDERGFIQPAARNAAEKSEKEGNLVGNSIRLNGSVKIAPLQDKLPNETEVNHMAKASKIQIEPKKLPKLKEFTIEEEEGSGGYGTVYKARRNSDGKVFAVKCPHPNANSHHINNEMKMLERFGGRSFVIKYEGSFKSGNSECFLLEHVKHDRPEVLKKEITVPELCWYGYCLFKALASLHKQGIAHRDVKPGNFLFSRKLNKGYLIDFNLASDLHRRFMRNATSTDTAHLSALRSNSNNTKEKQKQILRRSTQNPSDVATKHELNSHFSQKPADVSGLTSIKDHTSTRTSQERRKQPIMYQALRKELVHFLNDTVQSSPNKEVEGPTSRRKRVAAVPTKSDRSHVILTPMPLYCSGASVAGSGAQKSKGEGKHRKEGPCAGTKGFRAPEVLYKSFHQSCKIDIWSAGVTLLYLIIGRTPFGGDPEHRNTKEIAKLRGSEDLWEVAKLHNCESSFPKELFDVRFVQSVNLREWCNTNTRRPEFIKNLPDTLLDLIDKCLTVNPRCRISAEEALAHKFFQPCYESLRKRRLIKKSSQPSTS